MNVSEAMKSRSMKTMLGDHVLGQNLSGMAAFDHTRNQQPMKLLPGPLGRSDHRTLSVKHQNKIESVLSTMNKLVKGKLSLGARILQVGRIDQVFKRIFIVRDEERLLKASRCSLSTTAGPIPGRLFISTEKIAFCSDRAIAKVSSAAGDSLRFHYKIVIPLSNIKRTTQCENMNKPTQKYVQVVTTDEFEFWFMGFLSYQKTFKCLQQAVSQSLIIRGR